MSLILTIVLMNFLSCWYMRPPSSFSFTYDILSTLSFINFNKNNYSEKAL